jgi:integrase
MTEEADMEVSSTTSPEQPIPRPKRSTRKRDPLPRGLFIHPSSTERTRVYAIRFVCGACHVHQEKTGPLKAEALRRYHKRRGRVHDQPGWCPLTERRHEQERAAADRAREAQRITFREFAHDYVRWAKVHHRGWRTEECRVDRLAEALGDTKLDAITTVDVERVHGELLTKRSRSTVNRYRIILHAMFNRAIRHGLVGTNPVKGVAKFKEPEGRVKFLMPEEETAVREALRPDLRPLFTVSVHTGLRWSEQMALEWRDVDLLTGLITVRRSKSGYSRQVPMNSLVRAALVDLGSGRKQPQHPPERVFGGCTYTQADKFFPKAVERAQEALGAAGRDVSRLDGYTWHCNRHTFASRLVMAGVDLRTVQQLGGWRTLAMVMRYSHLSPAHLVEAVERLVSRPERVVELRENFESIQPAPASVS